MTIKELFYSFAQKNNITVQEINLPEEGVPAHQCMRFQGQHAIYEGHALCLEDENLFIFHVIAGVTVPEDKKAELSRYLLEKNYSLKIGNWYIEPEGGILTVRGMQLLAGADWEKEQMIENVVTACGYIVDEGYPEVMRLLFNPNV